MTSLLSDFELKLDPLWGGSSFQGSAPPAPPAPVRPGYWLGPWITAGDLEKLGTIDVNAPWFTAGIATSLLTQREFMLHPPTFGPQPSAPRMIDRLG